MKKSHTWSTWLVAGLIYIASTVFAVSVVSADSQNESDTNNQQEQTTTTKVLIDPEIAGVTEEEPDCE